MSAFAQVQARVTQSDWVQALDFALTAWRKTRAPAWANLIEALSSRTTSPRIEASESPYGVFHLAWLARAEAAYSPDIEPLMDTFAIELAYEAVPGRFEPSRAGIRVQRALSRENMALSAGETGPFQALARRVDRLALRGADPRVAKKLARFLELAPIDTEPGSPLWVATYGPVFDLLEEFRDPRILRELEGLPASSPRDRVFAALSQLKPAPLREENAITSLASELGFDKRVTLPPFDEAPLFARVVEAIDDDTPRVVLADRWLELGDRHGEFVALQLKAAQNEASSSEIARMASLLALKEQEWLGALTLLTRERRFQRGFLEEFALAADATVSSERWDATLTDARLGTVRRLRVGAASDTLFAKFLHAPSLLNLEEVEVSTAAQLEEIVRGESKKLRRVDVAMPDALVRIRSPLVSLANAGLDRITLSFDSPGSIADYVALLELANARTTIVMRAPLPPLTPDTNVVATGRAIDIVTRDAFIAQAVFERFPKARFTLSPSRVGGIHGPDAMTRRLAAHLREHAELDVTLDAAWQEVLRDE